MPRGEFDSFVFSLPWQNGSKSRMPPVNLDNADISIIIHSFRVKLPHDAVRSLDCILKSPLNLVLSQFQCRSSMAHAVMKFQLRWCTDDVDVLCHGQFDQIQVWHAMGIFGDAETICKDGLVTKLVALEKGIWTGDIGHDVTHGDGVEVPALPVMHGEDGIEAGLIPSRDVVPHVDLIQTTHLGQVHGGRGDVLNAVTPEEIAKELIQARALNGMLGQSAHQGRRDEEAGATPCFESFLGDSGVAFGESSNIPGRFRRIGSEVLEHALQREKEGVVIDDAKPPGLLASILVENSGETEILESLAVVLECVVIGLEDELDGKCLGLGLRAEDVLFDILQVGLVD